ncbi:type 2 isopentenyl-diphosphate Delta-isomerase [[Eubacterium] cellulosolvens]
MNKTTSRKSGHIQVSLNKNVESSISSGLDDIRLIHMSLPEIDLDKVDTNLRFLEHDLKAPFLIEPMTGGTAKAEKINGNLAEAAEKVGVAIGIGSQRAALEDPKLEKTFKIARKKAPSAPIFANIGCSQLLEIDSKIKIQKAIDMIEADALMIHLNPLQEAIQPEGETHFNGILEKISNLTNEIQIPMIVKETGAGISKETATKLSKIGVKYLDIAGVGGTSWAGVEYHRAEKVKDRRRANLGKTFWNWGIPTVISLIEVLSMTDMKVIASGGIRSGVDSAKAIALGAELSGMALPLLEPANKSSREVEKKILESRDELRTAMFLTSSATLNQLKKAPLVVLGETYTWLTQRGVYVRDYLERKIRI